VALERKEVLSPALKSAMRKTSEIAKDIGLGPEKLNRIVKKAAKESEYGDEPDEKVDEEQIQKVQESGGNEPKLFLPIALTHGLVSEKEKIELLKPLSLPKKGKTKKEK
jgi:hypothetical protein